MKDAFGRGIDYLRLSVTDRCNLRCHYCMPEGRPAQPEDGLLSWDELLSVCRAALAIGICRFKITGGEPLTRPDVGKFIAALRQMEGVKSITLTTNALLLEPLLPELAPLVDGINISLDAVSEPLYRQITGRAGAGTALHAVCASAETGVRTKINTVLLEENSPEWLDILALSRELTVDVRYIERMPVGSVRGDEPVVPASVLLSRIRQEYPDLRPAPERRGNGPASYYQSGRLLGRVGIIAANSQRFCDGCNRIRLTSTGQLRPCLGHAQGTDLREALRSGISEEGLQQLLVQAVRAKPASHNFAGAAGQNPARFMNEIGG